MRTGSSWMRRGKQGQLPAMRPHPFPAHCRHQSVWSRRIQYGTLPRTHRHAKPLPAQRVQQLSRDKLGEAFEVGQAPQEFGKAFGQSAFAPSNCRRRLFHQQMRWPSQTLEEDKAVGRLVRRRQLVAYDLVVLFTDQLGEGGSRITGRCSGRTTTRKGGVGRRWAMAG